VDNNARQDKRKGELKQLERLLT